MNQRLAEQRHVLLGQPASHTRTASRSGHEGEIANILHLRILQQRISMPVREIALIPARKALFILAAVFQT
jgi:hypothetical protein